MKKILKKGGSEVMLVEEFVAALQYCIREEFVAASEIVENTILVRFLDGKLIRIIVEEVADENL